MVKLIIIDPKNQNKYKNKFLNHYNNGDLTAHMVYMPGCGHCDDMKPSWKSACQKYNNPDYKMITIIHMQSYSDFMGSKDSPMGFPHVVAHRNQKIISYNGDRSEQDISNWLDKHSKTKKIVFRGGKKSLKYKTFHKITKKNKKGNKTRRYKKKKHSTRKKKGHGLPLGKRVSNSNSDDEAPIARQVEISRAIPVASVVGSHPDNIRYDDPDDEENDMDYYGERVPRWHHEDIFNPNVYHPDVGEDVRYNDLTPSQQSEALTRINGRPVQIPESNTAGEGENAVTVTANSDHDTICRWGAQIDFIRRGIENSQQQQRQGGKKTKHYKKKHRTTIKKNKHLQKCNDLSTSKYNRLLESKHIANKITNKKDKLMFLHRGNIHNIGNWTPDMKRRYKTLKLKYSMKPNTKEWDEFKKLTKCNITRHISLNNNVRVIGILSTPTYTDASLGATSFIPQSYVKWAELHGARIIPIQYDLPLPVIDSLLEQINGLILIGGIIERNVPRKHYYRYLSTLSYIFKKIIHYNLIGNHFPIFSICLGFELLPMITISKNLSELSDYYEKYNKISQHRNINQSSIQFCRLNKKDENEMLCKPPQKYFSKNEINKIEKTPVTYFTHGKAFLMNEKYMKEYNKFLTVTATAKENGKKVVAMYQYKSFPFFGTQFHPEKSLYEWREEAVSHTDDAIMFSNRLCKIFMDECNKNYNISAFVGNNNNNMLIENYDLLSRENTNKILYPHNNKNVNSDILGATYYFGRLDNIQSNLTSISNIPVEELKHNKDYKHLHIS